MSLLELRRELGWRLQNMLTRSALVLKRPAGVWRSFGHDLTTAQQSRLRELGTHCDLSHWPQLCTPDELRLNL